MTEPIKSGFRKIKEVPSPETGSTAVFYEHNKSGAKLVHLLNEDPHLAFGVGFRTPPKDSTGVAHIVEHAVLSGSRKFKTKEPFMDLLKSSMNTFLNAMTFPHMTIYPVASTNAKDFHNLTDVYLDAVFFPSIYEKKEIFMQEGWHYEIFEKEEELRYNGVVYNEMKGAYSSAEANVGNSVSSLLNKGTTYEHESGGDPYEIPKLTREDFLNFHKKYYHPSNAMLFLYGDVDLDDLLPLINDDYLSAFDKKTVDSALILNREAVPSEIQEFYYPAQEGNVPEEHSYLSYAVDFGKAVDPMDYVCHTILNELLLNSSSSPLRQALSQAKLGEDVVMLSENSYFLPFGFAAKNTSDQRMAEFVQLVDETLEKMAREGIDEMLIEASINHLEFGLREGGGTLKAIYYFIKVMHSFVYDRPATDILNFSDTLEKIKVEAKNGLFEKLILERIVKNPHKVLAIHRPKIDFFHDKNEAQKEELAKIKAAMTEEEITQLIQDNKDLLAWQNMEESEEIKATIPSLALEDVQVEVKDIDKEEQTLKGAKVFYMPYETRGISYLSLSFDLKSITKDEIFWAAILGHCFGITDTQKQKYSDLNNQILRATSGIHFYPMVFRSNKDPEEYTPRFQVTSSAIEDQDEAMLRFMEEVLLKTSFEDLDRLHDILLMTRSEMEQTFDMYGQDLVMRRLATGFNQGSKFQDHLSGIAFYDALNDLLDHYEEKKEDAKNMLEKVAAKIFVKKNLVVALTAESSRRDRLFRLLEDFMDQLPAGEEEGELIKFDLEKVSEGITSASGVQYVSMGANLKNLGYEYDGKLSVLSSILSIEYLHMAIRAKGGAYGAGIVIEPSGNVATYSYRDPNLTATIQAYQGMADFVRGLPLSQKDVESYVISTLSKFNPPMVAAKVNGLVLLRYFIGSSVEMVTKRMKQARSTTRQSLMDTADMLEDLMNQNHLAVYGNANTIKEHQELFMDIRPIRKRS